MARYQQNECSECDGRTSHIRARGKPSLLTTHGTSHFDCACAPEPPTVPAHPSVVKTLVGGPSASVQLVVAHSVLHPTSLAGHVPYKATFLTTSSGTNFIFAACSPRVRVLLSCPGGIRAIQVEELVCVIDSPLSASCSPSTGCTRLRAAEQMSPCSPRGMYGMRRQARSPIQPEMIHSPDQSCMLIQPGGPPAS